jgi:hypothetical protein
MTAANRTTIKSYFQTGDKPNEGQFSDFIDSCAFLAETSAQVFSGSIGVSATLSANRGEFATVSAGTANLTTLNVTNFNTTTVSAGTVNAATVNATNVSAGTINATTVNAAVSASSLSSSGTTTLKGTATNDSAAAGYIGEYVSNTLLIGSAIALTNGTPANVTTISLTAGDWDVWVNAQFTGAAGTVVNYFQSSISNTSAAIDMTNGRWTIVAAFASTVFSNSNNIISSNVGPIRISLSGTTTIYLVAQAAFTTSTCSAYGTIQARRRR